LLYGWGRRWTRGFFRFFTNLVHWVAGNEQNHAGVNAVEQSSYDALEAAFGKTPPQIYDYKAVDGEPIDMFTKWDGFRRYYVGPKSNICNINARAAACLKSAYTFKPGNLKYLTGLPAAGHYIIDPKRPPFSATTGAASLKLEKMENLNKDWVKVINDAVYNGKQYLINNTQPNDIASSKNRIKDKHKDNVTYETTKSRDSYVDKNVMSKAIRAKHFFPEQKTYVFKDFGNDHKNMIIAGAKKYATCKKLLNNTERPECNGSFGADSDSLGFGYLFETETEAAEWAEYTYELHYVYSSVSKGNYIGYPLLGSNFYFEAVGAKIALLQGIWARRAIDKAEAAKLYESDLEKRMGDYSALGQAYDGTKSLNLKFSKRVFDLMADLNFSGTTNMESFNQSVAKANAAKAFSGADLSAVNALRKNAIRRNEAIKRELTYKKENKNNKGLLVSNNNPNAQKLLNPIQSIAASNPGGSFSSGSLGSKLGEISKQLANISKNQKKGNKEAPRMSPFSSNFKMPSYGGGSSRASYNNNDSSSSSSAGSASNKTGVDNSSLLKSLKNNKELTERLAGDNLFTIVSKAYKRNYGRVLSRNVSGVSSKVKAKKVVTDKEKEQLKILLESN
jgi:predicted GIY-YIG superfamily endonuclease